MPRSGLFEQVENPELRALVDELRAALPRLHSEIRVHDAPYELSATFRDVLLCRVVPYREVLHVQVGQDPEWETRLHGAREWPGVMERIVRVFLHSLARTP